MWRILEILEPLWQIQEILEPLWQILDSFPHLNSRLGEFGPLGEFLSRVDVGVLSSFKGLFKFVKLVRRERGSRTTLFSLQEDLRIRLVIVGAIFSVRRRGGFDCAKKKQNYVQVTRSQFASNEVTSISH